MPAPDYPRVPIPDPQEPDTSHLWVVDPDPAKRWWYQAPIPARIHDGLEQIDRRIAKFCADVDDTDVVTIAKMIERGHLHDGWPWELTAAGKAVYRGSRRKSRR